MHIDTVYNCKGYENMGRLLIQLAGTNTTKALSETLPKNVLIVDEDLHQLRLHDGTTQGGHIIGDSSGSGVPIGTIIPFAGNSIPNGYLLCDGSAISRTDYASLFAVIGTIYGSGDGNSTFNLPNMESRVPVWRAGDNTAFGSYSPGKIPNINGQFAAGSEWCWVSLIAESDEGPFKAGSSFNLTVIKSGGAVQSGTKIGFDASRCSSVYNNDADRIMMASLKMNWLIKYI